MKKIKKFFNKIKTNIIQIFNKIITKISQLLAEILIVIGLFFIIHITFVISSIAGFYLLGGCLLGFGIFIAGRREDK